MIIFLIINFYLNLKVIIFTPSPDIIRSAPEIRVNKGVGFNILSIYITLITLRETSGIRVGSDILDIYITSIALRETGGVDVDSNILDIYITSIILRESNGVEVKYIKSTESVNKVEVYNSYLELNININTFINVNKSNTTS
jgi:hypothetical protein